MNPSRFFRSIVERLIPIGVLVFLLAFSYATFFQVPYVGFDINPSNGEVINLFVPAPAGLQLGDRLRKVGERSWEEIRADKHREPFEGYAAGQIVPLEVARGGLVIPVAWQMPGAQRNEVLARLINLWPLAYLFWLAGTVTLLNLRPKDARWRLFTAFFFLTAAWLITGSISRWRVWESAFFMRSLVWLSLPVYLHLHWVFPKPLGRKLPAAFVWTGYLLAGGLALAEWFGVLPSNAYSLGILLTVPACLGLLFLHYLRQPDHRRTVWLLGLGLALTFAPWIGIILVELLFQEVPQMSGAALLTLPVLPAIYFYVVYRRQLGGLELRANRVLSLYVFFTLVGTLFLVLQAFASTRLRYPGSEITNGALLAVLAGLVTAVGYPRFSRWIEARLLGMPAPPEQLLETYTPRLATSLEQAVLVNLLRDELLPNLLVRQSVLLWLEPSDQVTCLLNLGVEPGRVPTAADLPKLRQQAEKPGITGPGAEPEPHLEWVRLALPLRLSDRLIGFWLFGKRAPDDFYSQAELSTFQALASQVAIALTNIHQARQLQALYQTNIERYEQERTKLARDLHDEVLNQVVVLGMYVDLETADPRFSSAFRALTQNIRRAISGLRPPMLDYGLPVALEEMLDELSERVGPAVALKFDFPDSPDRCDPAVEHHLYRIVQQACENAVRHAQAQTITVSGRQDPGWVRVAVTDDGVGFDPDGSFNLSHLLSAGHFGLVGMFERARLIKAEVAIHSRLGAGTQVTVEWKTGSPAEP